MANRNQVESMIENLRHINRNTQLFLVKRLVERIDKIRKMLKAKSI